jgi:hypothetical protein
MLIYASSGPEYFAVHGEAFINSAKKCGHQVQVDMAYDFPEWREKLQFNYDKVFNAHLRCLRLPEILEETDVLMLDIDSIINHHIEMKPCDMALFFRPWLSGGGEVLMTASYWNKSSKPFAERVRERLFTKQNKWGDDQKFVWKTYKEMGNQFDIECLDQDFVCYNFDRDAPIWTCKGPARKDNPVYLARRAAYA